LNAHRTEAREIRMESHDDNELLLAEDAFLELVQGRFGHVRTEISDESLNTVATHYAAAALMRGCDFLGAALRLIGTGYEEGIGVLCRTAWECWLTGTFLLFLQDEALIRLERDQLRQEVNLAQVNGITAADFQGERQAEIENAERARRKAVGQPLDPGEAVKVERATIEAMARDIGPLGEAATGEPSNVLANYNLVYRALSGLDAHGMRALDRYVVSTANTLALRPPTPWMPVQRTLAVMAMHLCLLAGWGHEELELDPADLEVIQNRIVAWLTIIADETVAQASQAVRQRILSLASIMGPHLGHEHGTPLRVHGVGEASST
jgi:hypothetical protein